MLVVKKAFQAKVKSFFSSKLYVSDFMGQFGLKW